MQRSLFLLPLVLFFLLATDVGAQWVATNGPYGGNVSNIVANESGIIARVDSRILWHRVGETWEELGPFEGWTYAATPFSFFSVASDQGILRSTDVGESWDPVGLVGGMYALAVDGDLLYAAVDSTIHLSVDDGESFEPIAMVSGGGVSQFAVRDSILILSVMSQQEPEFLLLSTDDGETWNRPTNGLPQNPTILGVAVTADGTIWISYFGDGLYYSTDGGESFQHEEGVPSDDFGDVVADWPTAVGNSLFVATEQGVLLRRNGLWNSWLPLAWGTLAPVALEEGVRLIAASPAGIYETDETASDPRIWTTGFAATRVGDLVSTRGTILAATNAGLWNTTDRGDFWTGVHSIFSGPITTFGDTMIAVTEEGGLQALSISSDGGWSWEMTDAGGYTWMINGTAATEAAILVGFGNPGGVVGGEPPISGGIRRSTDGGRTWSDGNVGLPTIDDSLVVGVNALAAHGSTAIALTPEGIFRSSDEGASWSGVGPTIPPYQHTPTITHGAGRFWLTAGARVLLSEDDGLTWQDVSPVLPEGDVAIEIHLLGGTTLLAVGESGFLGARNGIEMLRRDGDRWTNVTELMPTTSDVTSMLLDGETVLAGTRANGVWRAPLSTITGVASAPRSPRSWTSVAPNPFATIAELRLDLVKSGMVEVALVDERGSVVARPFTGRLDAGAQTIALDGTALPSGLYLCRVVIDGVTSTTSVIRR